MSEHTPPRGAAALPLLLAGILAGVLLFGLLRLPFVPEHEHVHHHANFAVILDGEPLDLSASRYMEDVAACMAEGADIPPEQRVHLHDNVPDVVHVHAPGVTWGHLFANLGFGLGDDYFVTDDGTWYRTEGERQLRFVVNGHPVPTVHNRPIRSGDRLLIHFGGASMDDVVASHASVVPSNAEQYNTMPDPASCSGGEEGLTLAGRLRAAFWFPR